MKLDQFFSSHPVFRVEELAEFLSTRSSTNPSTRNSLLAHHQSTGRILRIRRGFYATVPRGSLAENFLVDPYLIAGRISDDAVLAYHTALEIHGRAYAVYEQFTYLMTRNPGKPFTFQGATYRAVSQPKALVHVDKEHSYVEAQDRAGLDIAVTDLERTLVDSMDRPHLAGGWEEIWRSLQSVEYLDPDKVVDYAIVLDNATTVSKVGFYLEQRKEDFMVSTEHLARLRARRPKSPHYMDRNNQTGGRFDPTWNLIVPTSILERSWEEIR